MKKSYISLLIGLVVFILIEAKPPEIYASSIFTSSASTDVRLRVLVNSLLPIDEEKLAQDIINSNKKLNGPREKATYELILYRTQFHYKQNIEFDTLLCDENGNILK